MVSRNKIMLLRALKTLKRHEQENVQEKKITYHDEDFQSYIVAKTQNFAKNLRINLQENLTISKMAGLSFVCSPNGQKISIADLGGGAGIDFFIAREIFDSNLNWDCIETDTMCDVASRANFHSNLKFMSIESFLKKKNTGGFSLYCNSSIQYIPDPIETVNQLLLKRPLKVAIVRTPFVLIGENVKQIQISKLSKNGPQIGSFTTSQLNVQNSVNIPKLEELRAVLDRNGYEIICENVQDGSFTQRNGCFGSGKSLIKTVDILAIRVENHIPNQIVN